MFVLKTWIKWKIAKKCKPYIKMDKKHIKFDETEIKEYKFHQISLFQ